MKAFIVATPLFDANMAVQAYRLCDRSGEKALGVKNDFRRTSEAFHTPGLDLVEKLGIEPFAGDKPLLVEVNRFQLLTGVPTNMNIAPEKLVCVLPAALPADADVLEKCAALGQKGYAIALDGYPEGGMESPLAQFAGSIVLDFKSPAFAAQYADVNSDYRNMRVVVANVPDMETFNALGGNLNALFTGGFYSQPITVGISEISPIKVNALQLLKNVNEEDFELEDIAKIIERDPSLSISLLRFINSGAVGLQRKVDSIKSAVAILGQQEVRRWATVAISVSLAEERPGEITKLSLVRAKFAENLAGAFELGVFQSGLFMAGLFSLLDVILQKPMAEAIRDVAVDERVRQALVDKTGQLYPVLELIYAYEHADWDKTSILMIRSGTDVEAVSAAFIDALVWYHQLLATIDTEEEQTEEAAPAE